MSDLAGNPDDRLFRVATHLLTSTSRPLYNTVLDITLITVGPQLDYFGYMSIHFTLVITQNG